MKKFARLILSIVLVIGFLTSPSFALTTGTISGTVLDAEGIAVGNAHVQVTSALGVVLKELETGGAGEYEIYPLEFGDYSVDIQANGYKAVHQAVHLASGGNAVVDARLVSSGGQSSGKEMTIEVKAKKNRVNGSATSSAREMNKEMIQNLPQGDDVKLPKLLAATNPGIVQGAFGQMFIRGNHANIQYQIDGVQLPDSPSSTFGQAISPRNIDHMEVITGGIPAEYGERLAAVVNIITKSGTEKPSGLAELGYGTYHTLTPQVAYGGSNAGGDFHYFLSAAFVRTDRGLDTPEPKNSSDVTSGGKDAVHDASNGNDQFIKLDWQLDNLDKLTAIAFSSYSYFEIPTFPSSFGPNDPLFNNPDSFKNGAAHFVLSNTNDTQAENNAYLQLVWKRTLGEHSFLQVAPYYKYSKLHVTNDPVHDLAAANLGGGPGSDDASSFSANRNTNNFGLKTDYSNRLNERNLLKAGFQVQTSQSKGLVNVLYQPQGAAVVPSSDNGDNTGYFESLYVQDDFQITKNLSLNSGVRFDATQFKFAGASANDSWIEPRVGIGYLISDSTKVHAFYGLLFQPAPVENLRDTFKATGATGANAISPYDIKAEKDNYYELGVTEQIGDQVINLNGYYKTAKNMLDDAQLLNTSIAQPYNFATGYAYGVELSLGGKINPEWSDYFNYSYEIAKGKGISGGLFSFKPGSQPDPSAEQFLDHVQIHTANAGASYKKDRFLWSGQEAFGSGLRTGPGNTGHLSSHFSTDTTFGYDLSRDSWISKARVSLDILNVFDNVYPLSIANGFNGSHYAAGRQFFVRLAKDF